MPPGWSRETHKHPGFCLYPSRLVVTDPDNFPEARFWPTSELPTIHERRIGIFGCVSHQLSAFVRSIGFKDCPSYLQNASTSGPSGDVALEEGSEIVSAGWEFFSSVADPREIQVYDGIDQAT
jgi:hypothetical protein